MNKIYGIDDLDMFAPLVVSTNEKKKLLIGTEESKVLTLLKDLEKICVSLVKLKKPAFGSKGGKRLICSDRGKRFLQIARSEVLERIDSIFPECRLNPFLNAGLDAIHAEKANLPICRLEVYEAFGGVQPIADVLNRIVDDIRGKIGDEMFKKSQGNYQRGVNENRKRLIKLVNDIFRLYAKVLVVRVDLSYVKDSSRPLDEQNLNHSDVNKHRLKLLKDVDEKLFKENLITYIWKLEYGPMRGYHYHTFFFFDGSKCRKDIDIARQIGEHWATVVTGGSGAYFNCNAIKEKYVSTGIGMIDHRDREKIETLKNKALEYIVKVDYYVRSIAGKRIRTLGIGALPKPTSPGRGRPRMPSSPMFGLRSAMADSVPVKKGKKGKNT